MARRWRGVGFTDHSECPVLFQDCSLPDSIMKQASIAVPSVTVIIFSLHGHLPCFVNGHACVGTPIYEMVHQQPVRAVLQQSQFIFMLFHSILCVSTEWMLSLGAS